MIYSSHGPLSTYHPCRSATTSSNMRHDGAISPQSSMPQQDTFSASPRSVWVRSALPRFSRSVDGERETFWQSFARTSPSSQSFGSAHSVALQQT